MNDVVHKIKKKEIINYDFPSFDNNNYQKLFLMKCNLAWCKLGTSYGTIDSNSLPRCGIIEIDL